MTQKESRSMRMRTVAIVAYSDVREELKKNNVTVTSIRRIIEAADIRIAKIATEHLIESDKDLAERMQSVFDNHGWNIEADKLINDPVYGSILKGLPYPKEKGK